MATQGKIKTLYSDINSEEALFPRTKTNAVSDQNGVGLDAILDKAVYTKSVNDNELNTAPVNADTLNGNNADYFASKSYVAVEIAKAKLDGEDIDIDLSGYATKDDLNNLATKDEIKAIDFPVDSINGKTGAVTLNANDVNARANTWMPTASDVGAAPSSHTHNYAGSSSAGGAATSANKVNKNLVVKLNGGSTEGTDLFTFNGSAAKTINITPSAISAAASSHNHAAGNITSGTLGVARGGTGVTANPSMLTNLGSTRAASVFAASPRPGVTGTLPIANGGTGATGRLAAAKNLTNEAVSSPNYIVGFTHNWGKFGYTSLAQLKTSLGMKVLWKNASPGSAFAAQTITVSGLNQCSCIAIIFKQAGKQHAVCIQHRDVADSLATIANGTRWESGAMYVVEREVTTNFSKQTINFKVHAQNGGTGTDRAIPLAVIGLW